MSANTFAEAGISDEALAMRIQALQAEVDFITDDQAWEAWHGQPSAGEQLDPVKSDKTSGMISRIDEALAGEESLIDSLHPEDVPIANGDIFTLISWIAEAKQSFTSSRSERVRVKLPEVSPSSLNEYRTKVILSRYDEVINQSQNSLADRCRWLGGECLLPAPPASQSAIDTWRQQLAAESQEVPTTADDAEVQDVQAGNMVEDEISEAGDKPETYTAVQFAKVMDKCWGAFEAELHELVASKNNVSHLFGVGPSDQQHLRSPIISDAKLKIIDILARELDFIGPEASGLIDTTTYDGMTVYPLSIISFNRKKLMLFRKDLTFPRTVGSLDADLLEANANGTPFIDSHFDGAGSLQGFTVRHHALIGVDLASYEAADCFTHDFGMGVNLMQAMKPLIPAFKSVWEKHWKKKYGEGHAVTYIPQTKVV